MATAALAALPAAAAPPRELARVPPREPLFGPALSGSAVLWGRGSPPRLLLHQGGRSTVVWRGRPLAIPPPPLSHPGFELRTLSPWLLIARSAFVHGATLREDCRRPCSFPGHTTQILGEVWVLRRGRPHRLTRYREACPASGLRPVAHEVDADGGRVIVAEGLVACREGASADSTDRVVLVVADAKERTVILSEGPRPYGGVAIAGQRAAWLDREAGHIVVYHLGRRRIEYRVTASSSAVFDLAADGTVALSDGNLTWASPDDRLRHIVDDRASPTGVRVAGGRIAYVDEQAGGWSHLRAVTLEGRLLWTTAIRRPFTELRDFDFDGTSIGYALIQTRPSVGPPRRSIVVGRLGRR